MTFGEVEPISFWTWLTTLPQEQTVWPHFGVNSFFNLVTVWNPGVSFGIFASEAAFAPYALSIVAVIISTALTYWMGHDKRVLVRLSLALIIAGALSNVWDRMRFGAVADFLDFHINNWHYPAFNLADSCIVVGVVLLAIHTVFFDKEKKDRHET